MTAGDVEMSLLLSLCKRGKRLAIRMKASQEVDSFDLLSAAFGSSPVRI